jgi:hypothetical protein
MTPDTRLLQLLRLHGVAGTSADPAAAWEAFKQFGREHFESPGVGLLFQVGDFGCWYFDPVCQFEVLDAEGELVLTHSSRLSKNRPSFASRSRTRTTRSRSIMRKYDAAL